VTDFFRIMNKIAEVTFTSADRVRDVLHNFNADGFDSLWPKLIEDVRRFRKPRELRRAQGFSSRRTRRARRGGNLRLPGRHG
jgi:hypothetical protein